MEDTEIRNDGLQVTSGKEREIRINKVFSVKADNFEDACDEILESLAIQNMTFENEVWESAELVEILE